MARVQRGDVAGLVLPDEVSETILRGAAESSLVMQYARNRPMRAQNVTITEAEVTGANVFWVGEGARKQTDAPTMGQATWTMSAAELAVIIPLDEDVQDDAKVDLFALYKPAFETAIAQKLDAAALFGTDKPTAWGTLGTDIVPNAVTAGHVFTEDGTPTDAELLDLIAGTGATPATPDGALERLEASGYEPDAALAYIRFKSRLRGLKDADNRYIFGGPTEAGQPSSVFGVPLKFAKSAVWTQADAHLIMGDFSQAIVGTRKGIRYKVFDQGVITDGSGNVVYSLMEQDMVALRVTARYGFKVIADDTADGETLASGEDFPFAIVRPEQ
jgi:predicted phage gp36 major capsid-like protein